MANTIFIPPYVVNDTNPIMSFSQTVDWGLLKLDILKLHSQGYTGKGVKIGIVDSGCNLNHKDLNIASYKDFTGSGTAEDSSGHGTHVAGIIAAQGNSYGVIGVAPDSEIHIYKALDGQKGSIKSVTSAISAAIDDGMDIINMSLGATQGTKSLENLCKKAKDKGIIVVVASGNSGAEQKFYPASYEECIAVGAIDESMRVAYFTSYGEQLDVVGPGARILSTHLNNGYAVLSGTSMASPFVSGCLALMKQAGIDLTYDNITKSTIDIESPNFDNKSGYGILDPKLSILGEKTEVPPKKHLIETFASFFCKKKN
jgi:minor extracellular protease Epr